MVLSMDDLQDPPLMSTTPTDQQDPANEEPGETGDMFSAAGVAAE